MGVFAEFERAMIQERVRAGLRRAKETGTKSGKPIGRPTIDPALEVSIRDSLARGVSYRVTAETCGVSLGTVQRIAAASRHFGGVVSAGAREAGEQQTRRITSTVVQRRYIERL